MSKKRASRNNYLNPLEKRNGKIKSHAVFDIESNNWIEFEMAGFYDGDRYQLLHSVDELLDAILHYRNLGKIIFAHNGGRFDFLFLFERLRDRKLPCTLICQGARVTGIKIEFRRNNFITLQDSFALLPYSLSQLCDTFKPAHAKKSQAINFEIERVSRENPSHVEYLKYDCLSLWEILDTYSALPFIRDVGFKMTLASTSLAAWRTTLKRPIRISPEFAQNFTRASYAGGRCEIFRQVMGQGACFDANSLYPTMMLKPLPCEFLGVSHDIDEFGFHDVTVSVPECYVPILWTKTPKLVFPTGVFRGTFFSEELKLALAQGARVVKHHLGLTFSQDSTLFTEFIEKCYQLRKENQGNALNLVAKSLMNNTYGKFAERENKKSLISLDPLDTESWPAHFEPFHSERLFNITGLAEIEVNRRSPHMLCHIASAITAYGRMYMAESVYLPFQKEIHYTDTDSGFINSEIPTGTELGQFKKEYSVKNAFFLLPKGYYIETGEGKIIKKLKGFSRKSLEGISREMFINRDIRSVERKLASFRSALIRENRYLALVDLKKSANADYNKRRLLPGGQTRPWELKNGELR